MLRGISYGNLTRYFLPIFLQTNIYSATSNGFLNNRLITFLSSHPLNQTLKILMPGGSFLFRESPIYFLLRWFLRLSLNNFAHCFRFNFSRGLRQFPDVRWLTISSALGLWFDIFD